MTHQEIRADVAQGLLGASITLGLMVDGLRARVEPGAFSGDEHATLHRALDLTRKAGKALALLSGTIRGGASQ